MGTLALYYNVDMLEYVGDSCLKRVLGTLPLFFGHRFMFAADNYDHRVTAESKGCVLRAYSVVRYAKLRAMYHLRLLPSIFGYLQILQYMRVCAFV